MTPIQKRDTIDRFVSLLRASAESVKTGSYAEKTKASELLMQLDVFCQHQLTIPMNDKIRGESLSLIDTISNSNGPYLDPYAMTYDKPLVERLITRSNGLEKIRNDIRD